MTRMQLSASSNRKKQGFQRSAFAVLPLVVFTVSAVVSPISAQAREHDSPHKPNIIVILVDDLGYGDLSCYGATDLQTPAIDGLIASGMRFDSFYANCPVCSPTRASLLSGRYPELVGVPGVIRTHPENSWGFLDPQTVILPQMLKGAGYQTAAIGKWHLGLQSPNLPNQRGFDLFRGFLGDMMDDYYTHRRHDINYMRKNDEIIDPTGHASDLFSQWACEFVHSAGRNEAPFFLYLAYNAPHTPIQPPKEWLQKVKKRESGISDQRAKLVALIEHMDFGIGKVLAALASAGLAADTVVVFTSDNGGQLSAGADNGDLRDGKQSMYEGGLRVPAGVVWPAEIESGSRGKGKWLSMDIYPTICEIAGIKIDHFIEGRSFLPVLKNQGGPLPERDLFFHRREGGLRYAGLTIEAVRRGDWKLLRNSPFSPFELYNLKRDPSESENVLMKERRVYQDLSAALRKQNQRGGAIPWQPPGTDR